MEQEITQRKRAEEIVGERERQFRLLAENSTDMISRHDLDGRYLYVSPACRTLLGYSPEEMLGRSAYELVHEEDQPSVSAHHKHQLSTYATDPVVFRCLRRDGAVIWLEATSRLLLDAETGQPTEIHVSSRDITRRRVAELALRESEVRLRTVVSNVPVVLFAINKEGIFTLSEGLGLRKLGLKPGQIVGASVYDVYKDHPDVIDQVRRALEGETVVSTTLVGAVAFETYYTQTFDDAGGVSGLIGVGTDVTERLQAEEALRESERMYKTLIEQSSDPVYMIQDGRLVFVNHRWEEMFGYSSAEVTSPGFNILSIIAPESRVLVDKRLRSYARRETVPMRYEMKGMKRDGTILELDVSVADIEWKGKPAFQGIYRDITDQKRAEETTRHQQKTESLGILAGGIAHDFNNLLQSILGQTSLALSRLPKDTPAFSNVSKAEQTAKRAAELTRQLLAYSGKGKFNVRPLDLNALIRENLHFLELAIPKGVTLEENLEPSLPYIEADAGQIQQVVMNLIINASEAVGERTGRILLATSVETIPFDAVDNWTRATGTLTPGEFVKLEVVDNGVGMAADTLRKIFDPFFTTKVTGRGLGLSAVIGIVKGHHGGLRVESEAGRGTSFKLVFPVSASRPEAVATAEKKTGSRRYKGCVLVIDDEEQVREVVSDMLEDAGIETLVAPSGEEGIRTYKLHNDVIGLVLLDLSMPGLGGKETFRLLKQFDPQVKVVLSSGYSETEVTDDLRDLGLAGFIQKPFRYENLKELLSGFLPQDS
ncbi:MAG TPA: PAS domain S-box protein, partial [Bacteroidota bacterium]|nr:PAS domain S-box protein [Bacteroidota bacterium]